MSLKKECTIYRSINDEELKLITENDTEDFLEISLQNVNYQTDVYRIFLQILGIIIVLSYFAIYHFSISILNILFLLLICQIYRIFYTVKTGNCFLFWYYVEKEI